MTPAATVVSGVPLGDSVDTEVTSSITVEEITSVSLAGGSARSGELQARLYLFTLALTVVRSSAKLVWPAWTAT